jgi:hypothetical protein
MTASFPLPENSLRPAVRSLIRACAAAALSCYEGIPAAKIAQREWSTDAAAPWLLRAPTLPAQMPDMPALVHTVVTDLMATLSPQSAAARIFRDGLQLSFGRSGQISVPTLIGDPSLAAFVAEGWPIPVVQGTIEPVIAFTPKKLACIVVLTAEMVQSSNMEALIQDALFRSIALALDVALLDSSAASDARPAGLRFGIAPITADPSPDSLEALCNDVDNLFAAISPAAMRPPVYVMSLARATDAYLLLPHGWGQITALGSVALRNTSDMIAIAPNAVASVCGNVVEITASRESALQMDSAPTSPPDATTAQRSIWQTDCVAIKLKLPVSWGLRTPQSVAWLTDAYW